MQRARGHFLAGAGFTLQQHRQSGFQHAPGARELFALMRVEHGGTGRCQQTASRCRHRHAGRRRVLSRARAVHRAAQDAAAAILQQAVIAHPRQRCVEQRFVGRTPDVAMLQPEQAQPGTVRSHQAAVAEAQHAFAGGIEQGRVVMQPQQFAFGQAVFEEAVLDAVCRQPCQPQRVHLLHAGRAGDVEHARYLPVRIEDRHGRATEDAVRGEEVFAAAYFHRAAFDDRRADGIGAHRRFAPAHARHQCDAPGLVEKSGATFGIEDPAGGVGEQHDAVGAGRVRAQPVDLGTRQPPQAFMAVAQLAQVLAGQGFQLRLCIHR
ncbi:hypothetical protein D3C81_1145430 [compost metagenome]